MSMSAGLPATLRDKLAALARRIRLLRALRGLGWLILALALPFLGLFLADLWFNLPDETLTVALAALAGLALLTATVGLVLPLGRRLTPESLAALVEQHYPELAERLTSSVELSQGPKAVHGSSALVALLLEDTEHRARPLVFQEAFSARPTIKLLTACCLALALALLPALLWAEEYADFSQRLLLSWFAPPPFVLHVQPGNQVLAVGRPLTVQVRVQRRGERVRGPAVCLLVHTDVQGQVGQMRMQPHGEDAFVAEMPRVTASLSYRVEAGRVASDSYTVTAVEPVELAGAPVCTITPPPYASQAVHPPRTLQGFSEVAGVEHSRIKLEVRFSRPAEAARLEIATAKGDRKWGLPLTLSQDRKAASMELPSFAAGAYCLAVAAEAEHHIATRHLLPGLTLRADAPPLFTQQPAGGPAVTADEEAPSARRVTPDDVLPLKIGVEDDLGVGPVVVEYRINDTATRSETVVEGAGKTKAEADYLLRLAGKVKDGDVVRYRVRAADTRRLARGSSRNADGRPVPEADLQPHVIFHPDREQGQDRWFVVRVSAKAEPLQKQDILAQRDQARQRIEAVQKKLREERQGIARLRQMVRNHAAHTPEQAQKLTALRKENRDIQADLANLAREAAELQALAGRAQDVAEGEMVRSDEALRRAQKADAGRDEEARQSDQELAAALQKLDDLQRFNDELARDRLDQLRMEQLARQEEDLARRAAGLEAAGDSDPARLTELRAEQEKVAAELQRLAAQSKLFRDAVQAAQAEQARKLAGRARELAQAQRELAREEEAARQQQIERVLADFVRKQQDLATAAAELGRKSAAAAQAVRAQPLRPDDAQGAAEALKQGQVGDALRLQDQAVREMDRAAADLERSAEFARDPRDAVRRLARLQHELEERLTGEAAQVARKSPLELVRGLEEIRKAQESIRQAVEGLDFAPSEQQAVKGRQAAAERTERAVRALQRRDPLQAWEEMQEARQALDGLAGMMTGKEMPASPPGPNAVEMARRGQAEQARQLARSQKELRDALRKASAPAPTAADQARQQALQRDTAELAREMGRLEQAASPEGKESAGKAAAAGEQARSAMAEAQARKGSPEEGQQATQRAADMLDQAAQQAEKSSRQMTAGQPGKDAPEAEAGRQAERALGQARQAEARLNQGNVPAAKSAMRQAAQAMQQAANQAGRHLAQQGQKPGALPGENRTPSQGAAGTGGPDLKRYEKELRQYAGQPWGQLPGELRTRIVQDLRGRYGEDYAGIIQRYFEQLADTGRKER